MNIEELTQTQMLLLAILVSFVTAIATGILTVSLLDQAPPTVTQTINRVVERTVERVVQETPEPEGDQTPAPEAEVITKEVTVVVNEEDLITDAIAKIKDSLVRIVDKSDVLGGSATSTAPGFVGLVIDDNGSIVTDGVNVIATGEYIIEIEQGISFDLEVVSSNGDLALLRTVSGELIEGTNPATSADFDALRLGQSVIAVSGTEGSRVSTGIIASFPEAAEKEQFIETSVTGATPGSPLVNIFGEVVGISTAASRTYGGTTYLNAVAIQELVSGS